MTFWEYNLKVEAHNLRQLDKERDLHWAAWLNRVVQAKKKKGKHDLQYVFREWKDFYDADKLTDASGTEQKPEAQLPTAAQRALEYARRKRDGEL